MSENKEEKIEDNKKIIEKKDDIIMVNSLRTENAPLNQII
jgi:hypothetical protein